ncbi:MAG: hypothetical protein J6V25_10090, partial [Oscillospiraceae bacterium]|nr:hypothetical protein [Oscillospiraceae bacterium]
PFGKDSKGNVVYMDGQIWIDSKRINDYPAPRVLMLDCTDTASVGNGMSLSQAKAELKRRAEEELANGIDKPDLEMTVDFLSMGDTEEYKQYRNLDKVYMFDRITVKDKVRGYDYTAEVVSVRHNLLTGMLESCTIGSLEKAPAARKIASWQVPTVDGGNIRLQSIVPGVLGDNAVSTDNIQDNSIVAEKLTVEAIDAINANIVNADIDWASIKNLQAAIATLTSAEIQNAEIDFAKIKDLEADTAIITKGQAGEFFITRLAVTEANLVSLTVGQLMVKGQDGGFYAVTVDETGAITTDRKLIENGDLADHSISGKDKLTKSSITTEVLDTNNIFGEDALVKQMIAANLDVDTLFARQAMIEKLNVIDITGNESIRIYVQKQDEMNAFLRVTENGLEIGKEGDPAVFRADNRTLEVTNVKTERMGITQRMAQNEEWAFAAYGSGLSLKWIGGDV